MNRVDISKLKTCKAFENEKVKTSFSIGQISDPLSVYIKDEYGKNHHIHYGKFHPIDVNKTLIKQK